jgi:ubiquinone biosynthesis protein
MQVETTAEPVAWVAFCEALDLGALVPQAYEAYRPAIIEGLIFFLENLDGDRAGEILADQLLLPETADVAERIVAIARHCPALHKLGQVLARDRRLPLAFRALLQNLESMPSKLSANEARALAQDELGPLTRLGIRVDEPPLAEASVAVVVPFTGEAVAGEGGGVLKLLKPGIEAKLEEDLDILQRLGALLDERCEAYGLPRIAYEETFLDVRDLLAREIRLDHEQANMRTARAAWAAFPSVVIPEVYPISTPRVTAMQRIRGGKVTEAAMLAGSARRRLGDLVVRSLIALPLWSEGEGGLFHADPHAGNLFATDDGKLAILDWSLVGTLSKQDRISVTQLVLGGFTLDRRRARAAVDALSHGRSDAAALEALIAERMGRLREGEWPGISWATDMLDEAATRARCHFGADLLMFRKALQTLQGVVSDVSPDCRPGRVLTFTLLRTLAAEWGNRAFAFPFSRHFATHLSNLDLTQLWASAPLIGQRQLYGLGSGVAHTRRPAIAR